MSDDDAEGSEIAAADTMSRLHGLGLDWPGGRLIHGNTFFEGPTYFHWYSDEVGLAYCGTKYFQVNKPAVITAKHIGECPDNGQRTFDIIVWFAP